MTKYTPTTAQVRMRFRHGHMLVEQEGTLEAFDRWFAPYKEALDVVQRVQWLGDILNGHDRWLAQHDKEVLDKAVERMYASAANDESDFRSLKAAVLWENDETLVHYENCDRTFGCTCGTRTLAVRGDGEHKGGGVQAAPGAQKGRGSGDDRTASRNSGGDIPASPNTGKTPDVKEESQ